MLSFQFDPYKSKTCFGACTVGSHTASRTNVYKETMLRMNLDVRRFQDTHWLSLLHTPHPHTSSHVTSRSILPIVTETCARHRVLMTCSIHHNILCCLVGFQYRVLTGGLKLHMYNYLCNYIAHRNDAPLHSIATEASSVLHRKALSSSPPLQARAPSGCRLTQNTEPI